MDSVSSLAMILKVAAFALSPLLMRIFMVFISMVFAAVTKGSVACHPLCGPGDRWIPNGWAATFYLLLSGSHRGVCLGLGLWPRCDFTRISSPVWIGG